MSDTNITKHPDMVHIGPASLCLWDEINDLLVNIGKVDELVLAKAVDDIAVMREVVNGVMVDSRAQPTGETYALRGKLTETLDPNTQYLVMKNCGTPLVTGDCSLATVKEKVQMFYDNQQILKHNNGFYGTTALPAPDSVVAAAWGTGGTIPTTTWTFIIVPKYGTSDGLSEQSNALSVTLGQRVTLTITAPTSAIPDSYDIYVYDSGGAEVLLDGTLIGNVPYDDTITTATFTSWVRGALFPGDPAGSFTVTNLAEDTTYDVGVDYSIDVTCGMFCLEDGGAIEDGQWILIEYSYYANPVVEMSIGPSARLPRYVHPVILAMHDDDRISPVGKGVEIHLWKVIAESGWEWSLSELNFDSGFAFEWKALLDRRYMNHGIIYTFHRQFSSFGLEEFGAMSDWNNAANCTVAAS